MPSKYARKTNTRSTKLFVIAVEGFRAEQDYFLALEDRIHDSRYKVVVLERDEASSGQSNGKQVYARLLEEVEKRGVKRKDTCCLVLDRDRNSFKIKDLRIIAKECSDKSYILALSNPCFDMWFYLHLKCFSELSGAEKQEMLLFRSAEMQLAVRNLNGGVFNPTNIDIDEWLPRLQLAIDRARLSDISPSDVWPNYLCSRVYLIVEQLLEAIPESDLA